MAKKEEKSDKPEKTPRNISADKEPKANRPRKSGKVKGPKGVGNGDKKTSRKRPAVPKKEPEGQKKEATPLPKPKKALPEEGTPDTPLGDRNEEKPEKKAKPARSRSSKTTKKTGENQPPGEQGKDDRKKTAARPQKMSRQKIDPSIRAEEKLKLSNTDPMDDIRNTAKAVLKEIGEKFALDERQMKDLEKMAQEKIPDPDELKKIAEELQENLASVPGKAKELMDQVLAGKGGISSLAEKLKDLAAKAAETTSEEVDQQKSSRDKPVEATLLSDFDVHLFKEGRHFHLYRKLGSHLMEYMGTEGVYFALWAPNAASVAVMGDFNGWSKQEHLMKPRWDHSGIWEIFIPEAKKGSLYKYFITSNNGYEAEKGDPFAFAWERPPETASVVWDLEYSWKDQDWMQERKKKQKDPQPYSVYELHLGSWRRVPEEEGRSLNYRELAVQLPPYLKDLGFTHVEFMPVMEHPFFGSWGYQITGYFAPSSRFGSPQDFMYLIDSLHQAGIGVILDWVPSHFPSDLHGLHYFDGTHLYEHSDPRKGFHPDWQSYIFNYGRNEVRAFLISNAVFWLDMFHADGLRVDAVASMLYLDYSREAGEWEPNEYGGRENLEAISLLKKFNEVVYGEFPDAVTIAEESTAWPMVSKPTYIGGLGFGMKWMMGWMHDTLEYFSKDPIHRRHHQNTITFSSNYAFSENFMLPLSHDEVVYGKGSILNKMPGDQWNKFANLRSLYAYMYGHPGTKLVFMGAEFAQASEWNHDSSLEWHLTDIPNHQQIQELFKELNRLYRSEPALYEKSFSQEGFEWIDINDEENSIISFLRKGQDPKNNLVIVCNLTPVVRENYRIGMSQEGVWTEIFNSDAKTFGGSDVKNSDRIETQELPAHHKEVSISLTLPPMAVIYLKKIE